MAVLVDGLPLGDVSTSMTINATAPILLALYVAAAEAQGVERNRISGTTQNDILKEYIARGNFIYPPEAAMRLVTDVFEFCAAELPKWNTISISGYHMPLMSIPRMDVATSAASSALLASFTPPALPRPPTRT